MEETDAFWLPRVSGEAARRADGAAFCLYSHPPIIIPILTDLLPVLVNGDQSVVQVKVVVRGLLGGFLLGLITAAVVAVGYLIVAHVASFQAVELIVADIFKIFRVTEIYFKVLFAIPKLFYSFKSASACPFIRLINQSTMKFLSPSLSF
jgi:hypothetical protein